MDVRLICPSGNSVGWVERSDTHRVDHFNEQDMTRADTVYT